jgi:hypothetical protein
MKMGMGVQNKCIYLCRNLFKDILYCETPLTNMMSFIRSRNEKQKKERKEKMVKHE